MYFKNDVTINKWLEVVNRKECTQFFLLVRTCIYDKPEIMKETDTKREV